MDLMKQEYIDEATKMWAYRPFMKCFVCVKGDEHFTVLKPTKHMASRMVREGYHVVELKRESK